MAAGLNQKEFNFVQAFLGPARGNATEAARIAGYGRTAKSHAELGHRQLKKVNVQHAIVARNKVRELTTIANADEIDRTVTGFLRATTLRVRERLRAAAMLNKVLGRHSVTHHVKGKLTLEDALDAVTKKREGRA